MVTLTTITTITNIISILTIIHIVHWNTGITVNLSYKEFLPDYDYEIKTYSGRVTGVSDASREWKDSPWDNIEIRWENNEGTDRVNPWEAVPEVEESNPLYQKLQYFQPPSLGQGNTIIILTIIYITIIY